jgi:hypothetical protein
VKWCNVEEEQRWLELGMSVEESGRRLRIEREMVRGWPRVELALL